MSDPTLEEEVEGVECDGEAEDARVRFEGLLDSVVAHQDNLLLHCCYTVVTLLLHCCHIVGALLYTVVESMRRV
jgi:hypothetical protein